MTVKKRLTILLIGVLSICLFFAFGFQIDVSGEISKEEGTTEVSLIGPLKAAANEAETALKAAEQAVLDALADQTALVLILVDPTAALETAEQAVLDAQTAVSEAQIKVDDTIALLVDLDPESPEGILLAAQLVVDEEALEAAELALEETKAVLAAVELILADPTALELILADPEAALKAAGEAVLDAQEDPALTEAQLAVLEAEAALEGAEAGTNSHIILNSNNGGSFDSEGNHSGVDGEESSFTFSSDPGFDLIWLRVGNTKFSSTEEAIEYIYSSDKKNLTIHAHFKKDKDYSPEVTVEETVLEDDTGQGDENDGEKGNGKGKDKEKSNNGKKNKNK